MNRNELRIGSSEYGMKNEIPRSLFAIPYSLFLPDWLGRSTSPNAKKLPPRRGVVLILVMVVVAMLSLAGLGFVATMHSERKTVHLEADQLRLEALVASGVESVKVFFEQSQQARQEAGGSWNNAELFQGVVVSTDEATRRRGHFSVVAPRIEDAEATGIRFGTENESAKLNLAALVRWDRRELGAGRRALMSLPGMTESIADALLDWVDADSTPRPSGAEADYYEGLGVPYSPRNGAPQGLEELLLVRGVTRGLLFGADANFNHRIEPEERRAAADLPGGPVGSGRLPWASLITVASAERNEASDGQPRINLNDNNLAELERRLGAVFDASWTRFILAYRQFGPYTGPKAADPNLSITIETSKPAQARIGSLLDLIGAKVRIPPPTGGDEKLEKVLASPLANDPIAMRDYLPKLLDRAAVTAAPVIAGRVNVNMAPRAVLRAAPGMDSALVERILAARGSRLTQDDPSRRHPTWLLTEGLVDLPRMRTLLRYLTTGGDVQRAQVVGFFDQAGPSLRAEIVVDASTRPARQIYYKDLRLFGRGYPLESLGLEEER